MKRLTELLILLAICGPFASASTSISGISDITDEFTDERQLSVYVTDSQARTKAYVAFSCLPNSVGLMIDSLGSFFHLGNFAEAKLRFDENPYETVSMTYAKGRVYLKNGKRHLRKAMASDRLIAKIEDSDVMRFDLLSAKDDLKEFDRLCREWRAN